MSQFSRPRPSGIVALELLDGDRLIGVDVTDGTNDIMLFTYAGKVIRFFEDDVRPMGRTARGVRGVKLQEKDRVIAMLVAKPNGAILTATENGYGKRTDVEEYRRTEREVKGLFLSK